ncbi:MAG: 30S ribosomal protein S2, partial [Pseudomonadota bacterium]
MSKTELPQFTIRQLLEAGVHFGHKTMRRNPKMTRYIHTNRNGISIIDLNKTANLLHNSLKTVKEIAKNNGRILFVATKKQAIEPVAEAAKRCGQYYVNFRWLGGMLTNWKTVSQSIKALKKIEDQLADPSEIGYNKKEKLVLQRQKEKLEQALGGIKNMGGYPDLVFIIDTHKESLAIAEAKKLNIPIMAILDSNCNPDGITFPIPGNDDSAKSIKLYCRLISDAAIAGIKENMAISGVDISKFEGDELPANIREL